MKFVKAHKKRSIVLGAIVVVVVLASVFVANLRRREERMAAMMNRVETATVAKRTLMSSVSATGTISSLQSKDITATVSGVKVENIPVEVGDYVQVGELLCEFDTEDLEENLKTAQTTLNNTTAIANNDLANAERSLTEARETRDIQNERNTRNEENAWNDYSGQVDKVSELDDELEALKTSGERMLQEIAAKEKEIEDAGKNNPAVSGGDAAGNKKSVEQLTAELQSLQAEYEALQASVMAKENELMQEKSTEDSLQSAYEKSVETKEDGIRSNDSTVHSKESGLENSRLNASAAGTADKQQIETYEEQISACTVTAPISGVVTAVNMETGDSYDGSVILTIEDDSAFVVEAQIDEYDIGRIKKGQEVVIKTNATGDEELAGTVIHVAPRATQGTENVMYTVKVSVDTESEMLRMDMTAKLSIILEKKEAALTVPYSAVCEDEDGKYYVEVTDLGQQDYGETVPVEGQNAYARIYVTKGIESDYYVEVSGEGLEEGMQVVVPASGETGSDIGSMMEQRGPMGGF